MKLTTLTDTVPAYIELLSPQMVDAAQPEQTSAIGETRPGDAPQQNQEKPSNGAPRKPRPKRPNYHEIHAKPLPLDVYALPAFIPHNPISIIRLAIALLSQSVWPPKSHRVSHVAYFSPETQSIHITDPASIRALWEQGFWGKGSLSRSEPQWLVAEKRRRGAQAAKTSTEVTQSRREERKQFKLERAKAQREAIEEQLRQEGKLAPDARIDEHVNPDPDGAVPSEDAAKIPIVDRVPDGQPGEDDTDAGMEVDIIDVEHLQLTPEEAFFLTYVLGVLNVVLRGPPCHVMHSHITPDNSFLLKYVVFHHFRSLGWVVRPGIKFAVDYLLYIRGPAFTHAEFAIMIIPSYSAPYWNEQPDGATKPRGADKEQKDWWWFHRVNRVQTQVMKTLMLVYVEVPEPWDTKCMEMDGFKIDVGSVLKKYTVREVVFKRWSPSRNRD
ncbi:tRNA-splicing endonuclease subunit SEN2 [Pyrenophora tritici-repentis Pt-1C-BFP]|uniref:tRNA-splicing endonuclease subunit Sen2 n=1 Tax=Pyrenophora tritici-repentis (strain Pt-1C-BFP) TaxID=426418 RepID=B2WLY3_PYRTR|nr:tRNA-splicing endonuclease subunit SEN2 [Pyrenophora tritici-repentis Pt-1C-BFP]EDU44043.1 tRNA-splicing endonuclease subunit SEN2 [Pyrenophora tritici-repentis Pt-1C-BFP]